jgi:preprotein translocase subunit SecB
MQNSPLQLEEYLLKSLKFALVSPLTEMLDPHVVYDPMSIEVNAKTAKRDSDPLRWRCELSIRSKDEDEGNFPYSFQLIYIGFFRVVEQFPADRVEQMVRTNAPALLYSAAREALMYLTGRGRLPAILIPSITFLEPPKAQAAKVRAAVPAKRTTRARPKPKK